MLRYNHMIKNNCFIMILYLYYLKLLSSNPLFAVLVLRWQVKTEIHQSRQEIIPTIICFNMYAQSIKENWHLFKRKCWNLHVTYNNLLYSLLTSLSSFLFVIFVPSVEITDQELGWMMCCETTNAWEWKGIGPMKQRQHKRAGNIGDFNAGLWE
jgi:hypothetical protein